MAYTILSESYGRRLPKITAEADSADDLAILGIDYAEGSTCNVGGTEYTLDKVSGWIIPGSGGGEPFLVTLTPTAADYSGTMDKTVAEIYAAYQAGGKIVFRMYTDASVYIDVPVQLVGTDADYTYPSFEANVIQAGTNLMVLARTVTTDDGTKNTYSTTVYTLTPAT